MQTTPYAKVLASIDGLPFQAGAFSLTGTHTVQLMPESTVGWVSVLWEIYSFPASFVAPDGWSLNSTTGALEHSTTFAAPIFTVSTATWGKYMVRLTVNAGLDDESIDESMAISVPSSHAVVDVGYGENSQFSPTESWVSPMQSNLRILEANVAQELFNPEPTVGPVHGEVVISPTSEYTYTNYLVDLSVSSTNITLPTSPAVGTTYRFVNIAAFTFPHTLSVYPGGSDTIIGGGSSFTSPSGGYDGAIFTWTGHTWVYSTNL